MLNSQIDLIDLIADHGWRTPAPITLPAIDINPPERHPPGHRAMRKVGGLLTGQLSDSFKTIEAAFLAGLTCCDCGHGERAPGRLRCPACLAAARPRPRTPAEKAAAKLAYYRIARERAAPGGGIG